MHHKSTLQLPRTMMLGKELWADSECALNAVATAVILTLDHVSPPVSLFRFSPLSLRHGVVVVCFEVPGWMLCRNGCSLWSLGSWLGGSPVSALSFVASFTLLYGPLVFSGLSLFCFFLAILMMTHKMSSCISFLRGSDPTSLCLVCFWCCCVLVCFVCLFALFGSFCVWWDCSLDCVLVHCHRFWGYRRIDGLAW